MKGDKNYDYTDEFSDIIHTERFISAAELSELFFSAPQVDNHVDEVPQCHDESF